MQCVLGAVGISYGKGQYLLKAKSIRSTGMATASLFLFGALLSAAAIADPPKKSPAKAPAAGNIASGKKVYAANNCANCHAINGTGGSGGPDLSTIGLDKTHTAAWF